MRGWYNNKQAHSLASRGIKSKVNMYKSKGELVIGEVADIFDILEHLKHTNYEQEVSVVVSGDNTLVDMNVGVDIEVNAKYKNGDYTQKMYHSHPDNTPPSISDIHAFLSIPEFKESWVLTPNYVYMMEFKNENNVFKDLELDKFRNGFWMMVENEYGDEFIDKYNNMPSDEKTETLENLTHEFIIPDNLWIDKYQINDDGTLTKIKEMR